MMQVLRLESPSLSHCPAISAALGRDGSSRRQPKSQLSRSCRSSKRRRIMARSEGTIDGRVQCAARRVEDKACRTKSTRFRPSGSSAPSSTRPSTARCTSARSRTRTGSGPSKPSASTGTRRRPRSRTPPSTRQRLDQMVRGRRHQRRLQLHRPASCDARQPGRDHLGRRRSQGRQEHHLSGAARRGLPLRQHPAQPQRREGRPRHHLHADDPGGGLRDARLRAHRRDPFGGVRRLLAGLARRPHRGLQVEGRHHRRRRRARRPQDSAQGQHRRRHRQGRRRRPRHRGAPHRRRGRHGSGARRLLPRGRRGGDQRMPVRAHERGRPAVHPLHVGLDRQAEGRAAHHRRLSRLRRDDAPATCSTITTATSTGAPPTSAG